MPTLLKEEIFILKKFILMVLIYIVYQTHTHQVSLIAENFTILPLKPFYYQTKWIQ